LQPEENQSDNVSRDRCDTDYVIKEERVGHEGPLLIVVLAEEKEKRGYGSGDQDA
jgi:hypothetical protein